MEALAKGRTHFKAVSITDGVMLSYLQYLVTVDGDSSISREADEMIGSPPFAGGLKHWIEHSPLLNLTKKGSPVLVVAEGKPSLLFMWEVYARLRYLGEPVDLVMLNTEEHVLTNPQMRLASQGGSVDWFRYWLKGERDATAAKLDQYRRWDLLAARDSARIQKSATSIYLQQP